MGRAIPVPASPRPWHGPAGSARATCLGAGRPPPGRLFRDRPGALDELDTAAAKVAADMAALALAHFFDEPVSPLGAPRWAADADVDDVEVDQAIGMVMAHLHASTETALAILRARAFTDGRLLGEVAREVLACKITFEPGEYGET